MSKEFKKDFFIYIFILSLLVVTYHLILGLFFHHKLNRISNLFLVPVALYSVFYVKRRRKKLIKTPYGFFIYHLATYIIVNSSFWIHAFYLKFVDPTFIFDMYWKGALYGMSLVWGIFLLIHAIASWVNRGFAEVEL